MAIPSQPNLAITAHEHSLAGDDLYARGQFAQAFEQFVQAVQLDPGVAEYHFRLASAAWKLNRGELVEKHYAHAARLDPAFAEPHKMLAQYHVSRGEREAALRHSELAMARAPSDAETIITRAVVLTSAEQSQAAWELLQPIVDSGYLSFHLVSAYVDLAPKMVHQTQAVALIERALVELIIAPALARLLHVSAASMLEGVGKYDEAFEQMRRAKLLVTETFEPKEYSGWISRQIDYFSPARMRALPRAMRNTSRPVLIVGMPRSGISLVEQILASHPDVYGAGELQTLSQLAVSVPPIDAKVPPYPDCLDGLSLQQADRLAGEYLAAIGSINATAKHVTDKMPQNFEWLGFAEMILPDGKIIHCRRDPRDTCLSCFMTDFNQGKAFTKDLPHLASYYRDYRRLMSHWETVLSVPMLHVQYEELVANRREQVARMLEFLGLAWDERCLSFHQNERKVTTASKDQVRRPMYASSVGRWKKYEGKIAELMDL